MCGCVYGDLFHFNDWRRPTIRVYSLRLAAFVFRVFTPRSPSCPALRARGRGRPWPFGCRHGPPRGGRMPPHPPPWAASGSGVGPLRPSSCFLLAGSGAGGGAGVVVPVPATWGAGPPLARAFCSAGRGLRVVGCWVLVVAVGVWRGLGSPGLVGGWCALGSWGCFVFVLFGLLL